MSACYVLYLHPQRPRVQPSLFNAVARMARDERWLLNEVSQPVECRVIAQIAPDLVLIEVATPATGIQQIRSLRLACPNARIVALGQVGGPREVAAALDAGADDVVQDSIQVGELRARLRRLAAPRYSAARGQKRWRALNA